MAFHLRLYTLEELSSVVIRGKAFEIDIVEGLTRYCLPFNHVILWTMKRMYMRLPATASIHKSMEKFEYDDSGGSSLPVYLASMALKVCRVIDAWNDRDQDPEKPCGQPRGTRRQTRCLKAVSGNAVPGVDAAFTRP